VYANYFFVDGSALIAQIRQLQRAEPRYRNRKLCPHKLIQHFMVMHQDLHGGEYKRLTLYFPQGDEVTVGSFLQVPNYCNPGEVRDVHFKYCGQKLKKTAEFRKFVDEMVPSKFQGQFAKSEKGVDVEICCDALKLAAASRLERLFLLSNDGDFIPLCRALKDFGANISIMHLASTVLPNTDLLREADSYNVVPFDQLDAMFFPLIDPTVPLLIEEEPTSEKSVDVDINGGEEPATEKLDVDAGQELGPKATEAPPEQIELNSILDQAAENKAEP
jgi:uncharacterized LabA/DUF88 family protein